MHRNWRSRFEIACLVGMAAAGMSLQAQSSPAPATAAAPAPTDAAYVLLELYNGSWESVAGGGANAKPVHLTNHCARTGRFFVCEQVVDGESKALVVFLPLGASGTTQNYLTQGLMVTAGKPGDWNRLEITGDRWVYSSEGEENGAKVYWRTVNTFSGPDKIHFEIQRSADAKTWQTTMSGDERRVNP